LIGDASHTAFYGLIRRESQPLWINGETILTLTPSPI
jgi:hypothetical protein